jgi:hypothetical protein
MTKRFEGRWLCPCGQENLGRFESCEGTGSEGCGRARSKDVRFYLPDNSPVVTDPDQLADATSGPDWQCSHCDGANKNGIGGHRVLQCVHCGNGRDQEDVATPVRALATADVLRTGQEAQAAVRAELLASTRARRAQRVEAFAAQDPANAGPRVVVWAFSALGAALVAFAVWFFFIATSFTNGVVTATEWTWSASLEQRIIRTDSGFHTPPSDATILESETRQNGMKDVQVGTKEETYATTKRIPGPPESYACGMRDLGNGYFEERTCTRSTTITVPAVGTRTVPVMRRVPNMETWRRWTHPVWVVDETFRAGAGAKPIVPPALPEPGIGERLTTPRITRTTVVTLDDGTVLRLSNQPELWAKVDNGEIVRVERNRTGSVRSVATLD